ncbi:Ank3 [Symbiodinium sp. CCMP2592]|nr:Ank3 [Symbiodinium sp. CCMP2592]
MSVVGDRVQIHGKGGPQASKEVLLGTVRFVGDLEAAFAPGEWLGVELDQKVGKHNGSVKGRTYFKCDPGHGLFVRPDSVSKVSVPRAPTAQELQAHLQLTSEVGTMRGEPADLTRSLEALQARLLEQIEKKVELLGEQLEARMTKLVNSTVQKVAAGTAKRASHALEEQDIGSKGATQAPKADHAPKLSLREKFGLADSKYDENIVLLDREDGAAAKYAKALEISGGEEKLRSFRQLSKELQSKHGLHEEQKDVISTGERAARSVKVNFQPFFPTLDKLFEFAHKHKHHFFDLVDRVATATHGTCAKPPLKGKERCESKARFKYVDSAGNIEWHRLTDIVRDTLSYENLEDMYDGLKLIDEDDNVEIVEFNDRYQTPLDGGYRDLQLTLRVQGKLVCELQLTTKYMLFIKESSGHRVFEIKRQLIADVAANSELECRKTLHWAGKDAEAVLQEKKKPLLHKAASQGNSGMVELFLQHGADVNLMEETTHRTALHEAMGKGHACAAWALISAGAKQDVKDADGQTPLLLGLLRQRVYPESEAVARCVSMLSQRLGLEELRLAKEEFSEVVQQRLKNSSELVSAAYDDNVQKVVEHLRTWANPNSASNDGKHALHRALAQGHTAVARQLLTYKADIWLTENGSTALDIALEVATENPGSLELLVDLHEQYKDFKNDAGLTFLMLAVKHGNADHIKQLLDKGIEKDARCADGSTALMLAAREGKTASLKELLDRNAEKDCQNNEGYTPLMLAMQGGHEECFNLLLDRMAKRGLKSSAGKTVLELSADNVKFRALLGRPTALMEAAKGGHSALVKELLEKGAEEDVMDGFGNTALMHAARNGQTDCLAVLLVAEADKDTKNQNGFTAYMQAAANGHTECAKRLTREGANQEEENEEGDKALLRAAAGGELELLQELLAAGAKKDARDRFGNTALMLAARHGQADSLATLLDAGAEKEAKNEHGYAAVMQAAGNGHNKCVKLLHSKVTINREGDGHLLQAAEDGDAELLIELLAAGANKEAKDKDGRTPLMVAAEKCQTEIVNELLAQGAEKEAKDKDGRTPLMVAAEQGHKEIVNELLAQGAEKEAKDKNGLTPLWLAADKGHTEIVKELLAQGAEKEAEDKNGLTPMLRAADNGHTEIVKELLAKGAEKEAKDNDGRTPVIAAVEKGHTKIVGELLATGAEKEAKDKNGLTPLWLAADKGHTEIVKELLAQGAEKEAEDKNGDTPLNKAAGSGHTDTVRELLAKGAEKEAKDKNGETPLHKAAAGGRAEIVRELLAQGAEKEAKNKNGYTPLHKAAAFGHTDTVRELLAKGAEKEAKSNEGETPLHATSRAEIVRELLAHGADKDAQDNDGETALIKAARFCSVAVWKELLAQGANKDLEDKYGPGLALRVDTLSSTARSSEELPSKSRGHSAGYIAWDNGNLQELCA